MKPQNLISVCEGARVLENTAPRRPRRTRILKKHEVETLRALCAILRRKGCDIGDFDGFFVGYTIPQISKEFDLLRFSKELVLNIEMKSPLLDRSPEEKKRKILAQMRKNYYYLKILERPVRIFTYVQEEGFYEYDLAADDWRLSGAEAVAECIRSQQVNYQEDPSQEFVPSRYVISPFTQMDRFLQNDYFLTSAQQEIKRSVTARWKTGEFACFTISADAGTGKTLLLYDIARTIQEKGRQAVIIHGGQLNEGQRLLNKRYHWQIIPAEKLNEAALEEADLLLADEAHRLTENQLHRIMEAARRRQIPVVFAYDVRQTLYRIGNQDIRRFLEQAYPGIRVYPNSLKTRIRTRQELASFIENMQQLGACSTHLNYDCVSVEYLEDPGDLTRYLDFLQKRGWTGIGYSVPGDPLSGLGRYTAEQVIGQEFPRVVLVMDDRFVYDDRNRLTAPGCDYDARGMLYQMATRAVDELKIIVTRNPTLYTRLIQLKTIRTLGRERRKKKSS